jgi:hypothetical protein
MKNSYSFVEYRQPCGGGLREKRNVGNVPVKSTSPKIGMDFPPRMMERYADHYVSRGIGELDVEKDYVLTNARKLLTQKAMELHEPTCVEHLSDADAVIPAYVRFIKNNISFELKIVPNKS